MKKVDLSNPNEGFAREVMDSNYYDMADWAYSLGYEYNMPLVFDYQLYHAYIVNKKRTEIDSFCKNVFSELSKYNLQPGTEFSINGELVGMDKCFALNVVVDNDTIKIF